MFNSFIPAGIILAGILIVLAIIGLSAWVALRMQKADLTRSASEKPEWMRNTPPAETLAAAKAEGQSAQVFHLDPGEALASPFAEQIEDILQARLASDPALSHYKVDLGTAPDGTLEIIVDGAKYAAIDAIPDAQLKAALLEAVEKWKKS